ncbi:MAG: hypothetical protein ACI4MB_00575 [Candidatus Coproplasma sp.]
MEYFIKFGQNAPVKAKVKLTGETITVLYALDGADFLLKIEKDKVVHKALGDGLEVEFVQGKRTVGRIKLSNASAPYEVYCSYLNIQDFGLGKDIIVVFDDGDGRKSVDISLIAKGAD